MGNRPQFAPKEFYHLYNRGTEKRKVFQNRTDYERFLCLMYLANTAEPIRLENIRRTEQGSTLLNRVFETERTKPLISIAAYCLMPNHFHFLVQQQADDGISKFMQKLTTAYTMYFNTKNERTGALFQGRFKSKHAGEDRYLKYLLAYIHLNPGKNPEQYSYSSYFDFAQGQRAETKIIDKGVLPKYFPSQKKFKREMREWLTYGESEQG